MVVSMFRLKSRRWFDRASLSSELEGILGAREKGKKCSEGVLGSGVFFGLVRVRKYRMIVCFKVMFKRDCWIEYNECLSTSGCLK